MTSPKPYDVLVSACEHLSINYNKERQSQLNSFLLCSILLSQNGSFQALMDNIQNSPICVRKMSKRETEKKKKKKFDCTEAVSEKQRDRWTAGGD